MCNHYVPIHMECPLAAIFIFCDCDPLLNEFRIRNQIEAYSAGCTYSCMHMELRRGERETERRRERHAGKCLDFWWLQLLYPDPYDFTWILSLSTSTDVGAFKITHVTIRNVKKTDTFYLEKRSDLPYKLPWLVIELF